MKSLLSTIAILLCLSVSFSSVFANPDLTDKTVDALQANNLKIERANIFWRYLINTRKSTRFDGYLPLTGGDLTHAGTAQTFINFRNTGGDFYIGKESSTAGAFFTGSSAYANVLYSWGSPIQNIINGVNRCEINNSGVNVNGILTGTSATFSGNVGIGTTTQYKFQVQAPGTNPGALEIVSAFRKSSSGGGEIAFRVHDSQVDILSTYEASANNVDMSFTTTKSDASQPERMRIQASTGNVGIGTISPSSKLYVAGGGRNGIKLDGSLDGTPTTKYLSIWQGTGASGIDPIGTGKLYLGYDEPADIYFGGANTNSVWKSNGEVGIGTVDPQGYKLAVAGKIRATEIKVEALPWSDFVFEATYKLPTLQATEQFIKANKHLAEIPSAAEVAKDGINLGEMNAKLLQKIEELTLHMIDFNKKIEVISSENQILKVKVAQLEGNR